MQPKSTPIQRPPQANPVSLDPFERLVDETAEIRMREWADIAAETREAQIRMKEGRYQSPDQWVNENAQGKELTEMENAEALRIKSSGTKEGSPLKKWKEPPGQLIAAINKGSGKLRDQIKKAFMDAARENDGPEIKRFLETAPESTRARLFGDEPKVEASPANPLAAFRDELADAQQQSRTNALSELAGGRKIEQLKEGKTFDEGRLVDSPLFAGRGGPQKEMVFEDSSTLDDISFDFGDNQKGIARIGAIARPVHYVRQAIFEAAEKFGEAGLRKASDAIGAIFGETFKAVVPEAIRSEFRPRPPSLIEARRGLRGQESEIAEKTNILGEELVKAMPTPEARVLAAKIVQNTATPAEIAEAMNDPVFWAAAEFVRNDFMRLGEAIIREGVGKYAKLNPADRAALADVLRGIRKLEDLSPELQKYMEGGIAKYFGEYLPRLYRSKEALRILK